MLLHSLTQGLPSVFRLLRWLAPQTPKRRLQLRSDKGMPCSTAEALQEIRRYFNDLCHTSTDQGLSQLQPSVRPVSFTVSEFAAALADLPSNTAVPSALPPALLWKSPASCLAQKLTPQLNEWLADVTKPPPSEWHVADIFLLLKPGKKPTAAALRPISLLHPVAKALAALLKASGSASSRCILASAATIRVYAAEISSGCIGQSVHALRVCSSHFAHANAHAADSHANNVIQCSRAEEELL